MWSSLPQALATSPHGAQSGDLLCVGHRDPNDGVAVSHPLTRDISYVKQSTNFQHNESTFSVQTGMFETEGKGKTFPVLIGIC